MDKKQVDQLISLYRSIKVSCMQIEADTDTTYYNINCNGGFPIEPWYLIQALKEANRIKRHIEQMLLIVCKDKCGSSQRAIKEISKLKKEAKYSES